jgi:hypothetical protein
MSVPFKEKLRLNGAYDNFSARLTFSQVLLHALRSMLEPSAADMFHLKIGKTLAVE